MRLLLGTLAFAFALAAVAGWAAAWSWYQEVRELRHLERLRRLDQQFGFSRQQAAR